MGVMSSKYIYLDKKMFSMYGYCFKFNEILYFMYIM